MSDLSRRLRLGWGFCLGLAAVICFTRAGAVELADAPMFTTQSVPGNVALALSVEFPTATTPSYQSTTAYSAAASYVGYFDPLKCYRYVYNAAAPASSYFQPDSYATSHACSSTASLQRWSGNYLNWASMQTLDVFRWALTGGYRSTDAVGSTVITKTYADNTGGGGIAPDKTLAAAVSGATPFTWASATTSIKNRGISLLITGTNTTTATSESWPTYGCVAGAKCLASNTVTAYNGHNSYVAAGHAKYANPAVTYELYVNVKVCDATVGIESNCVAYGSDYKPQGLMQTYSSRLRFSAFGYLNDSTVTRDGGVLRAPMKYIGPTSPVPGSSAVTNSAAEWSASTGVMVSNPDSSLAASTTTAAGVTISKSGVMNYLNRFGQTTAGVDRYKSIDPVSELYYAILRYFRNVGNVPAYSDMSGATAAQKTQWLDGFPVATSWSDPIAYSCQKNFILGIGDVYTHRDGNLPGSSLWTSGQEPSKPALVTTDATVNKVDVTQSTKMVAQLEGLASTIATSYLDPGRYDTYYIAGLAYDAHTNDMRADLTGSQTVNTYWVDVMEGQTHMPKNPYWLAAKYGGFTPATGFVPYAAGNGSATLALTDWYNNTDTVRGTDGVDHKRPDNYYPAYQGSTLVAGLDAAFSKISSETTAPTTTAFSATTRKISSTGSASYAASYDPSQWTGQLAGSTITYSSSGAAVHARAWEAGALLETPADTARKIITCCNAAGSALPFTTAALGGATLHARTLYSSFALVPEVASGRQSAANFLAYLRGDRSQEVRSGGAYRNRGRRLGDIAGSKPNPVAVPSFPYYDRYNAGYSSFKRTHASRRTVVYAGANDGMLHAFDGALSGSTMGTELFAYIPSFTYGESAASSDRHYATYGLASLGKNSFSHHAFVDATPLAFDLDLKNTSGATTSEPDWRTLLIGGLGKGGKGFYAIDVTNPDDWTSETAIAGKVMWEFTDARMGYSFGAPHVVKTAKYGWVVLLSSGYNNSDGQGYLFIVNPRTGALLEAVATGTGTAEAPLDMAELRAFIPDRNDYTADAMYAGDLRGNLWRFDLTATSGDYPAPTLLATLSNAAGHPLPVTTKPMIATDPVTQKRYVMVGTGQLLSSTDTGSSRLNGFFALVDGTGSVGGFYTSSTVPTGYSLPLTRDQLSPVTDLTAGLGKTPSAMGWYHDFSETSSIAEHMNIDGDVSGGLVAFAANTPNKDACGPPGSSRFFAVSFASGKSALLDAAGAVIASRANSNGMATEVAFQGSDGVYQVTVGDTTGQVQKLTVQQDLPSLRRLNWREISTVD